MRENKNIIGFFLLLILLIPSSFPILLQFKISLAKTEAREKLKTICLQTVHLKKETVEWTEEGSEIRIGNRLLDVKEYHVNGDELIVRGVFDEEETVLAQINQLQNQQKEKEDILLIKYFQLLNQIYFQSHRFWLAISFIQTSIYPEVVTAMPKNIFLKIPSPPPQV